MNNGIAAASQTIVNVQKTKRGKRPNGRRLLVRIHMHMLYFFKRFKN